MRYFKIPIETSDIEDLTLRDKIIASKNCLKEYDTYRVIGIESGDSSVYDDLLAKAGVVEVSSL